LIHNDMRHNVSKEFLNEFADAMMLYEPCDINVEDDNLS
jgi:hypothetical protein